MSYEELYYHSFGTCFLEKTNTGRKLYSVLLPRTSLFTMHLDSLCELYLQNEAFFNCSRPKHNAGCLSYFLDVKASLSFQPFPPFSPFSFLFLSFLFPLQFIPLFDKGNATRSHSVASSRVLQLSCGAFPSVSEEGIFLLTY